MMKVVGVVRDTLPCVAHLSLTKELEEISLLFPVRPYPDLKEEEEEGKSDRLEPARLSFFF